MKKGMKSNNKGYMLIEIIVASSIALIMAYFLIDITIKMVNKNNDYYIESVLIAEKNIVTKEIMDDINSMNLTKVDCSADANTCELTFNHDDNTTKILSINDRTITYGDYSKTFSKEVDLLPINISDANNILTIGIPAYTNYSKEDYGVKIVVPYEENEIEVLLPIDYTVTLEKGIGIKEVSGAGTYKAGNAITIDATVAEGYTWSNWTGTHNTNTKKYSFDIKSNVKNTANAVANTYKIDYTLNGGTLGSNAPISATFDKEITISNPTKIVTITGNANGTDANIGTPTSIAQTFEGWTSTTIDKDTASYGGTAWTGQLTKATTFKNLTPTNNETVTLIANWTPVALNLPTVTKTGHVCTWNTKANGSGTSYKSGASYTPESDDLSSINLYAICKTETYAVRYDANGGTGAPASQTKTYGITLKLSSTKPTLTGYTFTGWNTKADGSGTSYAAGASYTTETTVTLYAQWAINKVNIQFSTNGGDIQDETTASDGTVYTWKTESEYTGIMLYGDPIRKMTYITDDVYNVTENLHTINYSSSLSSSGLANWDNSAYINITKEGHKAVTGAEWICLDGPCATFGEVTSYIEDNMPYYQCEFYEGEEFYYYEDALEACFTGGTKYNDSTAYTASDFCDLSSSSCTVLLGVNWVADTYTVSYNANGGSGAPSSQTKTYNESLKLSSTKPTRTGYTFVGWNTKADGSGTNYAAGASYTTETAVTLYAQWEDQTAPTIPTYTAFYKDGSGNYTSGTWTNKQVNTTLTSTDAGTGVAYMQYREGTSGSWNNFGFSEGALSGSGTTFTGTEPWSFKTRDDTYYFRACDYGEDGVASAFSTDTSTTSDDNCSGVSEKYNIKYDLTAPSSINYQAFYADGSGNYTSGTMATSTVHTTISAVDAESGVAKIQYSTGNTTNDTWTTLDLGISGGISSNGTTYSGTEEWSFDLGRKDTYYFRACDELNNCSSASSVYNIVYGAYYKINYNANGGTTTCVEQTKTYGVTLTLCSSTPTRTGYTFNGWNTASDGSGTTYAKGASYTTEAAATLYAQWTINKVYVNFSVNGGTIDSETTASDGTVYTWTTTNDVIYRSTNGGAVTKNLHSINYGGALGSSGLANWDNSAYIDITKTGYTAISGSEWICLSGACVVGTVYNDYTAYNASDFCDASSANCTVVLGVNWEKMKYTIDYSCNGGSGTAPASQTKTYGIDLTLQSNTCTRTGYTFKGWSTDSAATSATYAEGGTYTTNAAKTLYAIWEYAPAKETITNLGLTLGEGTPDFSKTSCSSGCQEATVGIYKAEDNYGASYYFRGDVENNYVKFGTYATDLGYEKDEDKYYNLVTSDDNIAAEGDDMYWRIIRVNGDGTIRMIYDGTSARAIGSTKSASLSGWQLDGEDTDSARSVINNWYKWNILGTSYEEYLNKNVTFCRDERYSTSATEINNEKGSCKYEEDDGPTDTYYYSYLMKKNNSPNLICSSTEYLSSYTEADTGTKSLTYPVDFITAEEIIMAGASDAENTKFYLYNGNAIWGGARYATFWQHSPTGPTLDGGYKYWELCDGSYTYGYVDVESDGSFGYSDEEYEAAVKPVISLRADLTFTGSGTKDDPFIPVLP